MRIHSPIITGSVTNTNIVLTTVTSSISVLSASFASTASSADNLTVRGTLTAQTINVQTITSSIDYVTGSSINGSLLSNTHQFTGSTSITGSLQVNNSNVILSNQTSSMSVSTASYWSGSIQNATSASYAATASYAANVPETASYALQANSASFALTASYISGSGAGVGFPFSGSAIITGSLFVSGSTISGSFKGDGSQITGLTAGGKIHTQASAASTWTVSHNLGVQYPNVTVYDNNNNVIIPQTIVATDANTLTLTFGSAVAGYAVAGIGGIINVQGRTTQQYFTASTTWSFAHNLGDKYVSLQAFDDAFEMVIPTTIRLVDFTSSLLLFDSASSGYAVATIGGDLPAISSSYAGYTLQVASSAPYSASWVAVPNVTVTNAVSSSFAATASSADNLTVRGTLTAQTINVQTITSSIDYVTGSAKFGSLSTNTHQFTGSVLMTGSLNVTGSAAFLGNITIGSSTSAGYIYGPSNQIFGSIGSNTTWINTGTSGLRFNNAADNATLMFINNSGNIGIGTTSPSYSLDVNGGIAIRGKSLLDASGYFICGSSGYRFNNTGDTSNLLVINNNGNVYIGTGTDPGYKLSVVSGDINIQNANQTVSGFSQAQSLIFTQESNAVGAGIKAIREAWSSMPFALTFLTNSVASGLTEKMRITSTGNIGAGGSTTNIYNASDIRLKKNINTITYGLNTVSALNPVKFNWADGFEPIEADKILLGFIAQEVQTVIPEAVESFGGSVDLNGTIIENTLRVNEKFIIPVLVKAIQELSAKNTTLEERLTALENK
jgi:hypothetical protein